VKGVCPQQREKRNNPNNNFTAVEVVAWGLKDKFTNGHNSQKMFGN
jgi:hypothetical protein